MTILEAIDVNFNETFAIAAAAWTPGVAYRLPPTSPGMMHLAFYVQLTPTDQFDDYPGGAFVWLNGSDAIGE